MFIPKEISSPGIHSRHAIRLCRRFAALESEVRKRPFDFYGKGRFSKKKKNEKKIQVDLSFFQKRISRTIQVKCYCTLCSILEQYE